jgi:hypothetical protein
MATPVKGIALILWVELLVVNDITLSAESEFLIFGRRHVADYKGNAHFSKGFC